MPESVEMPAPVSTTTRRAWCSSARARASSGGSAPAPPPTGGPGSAIGGGHDRSCWHGRRAAGGGPTVLPCLRAGPPPSRSSERPRPRSASAAPPARCWPAAAPAGDRVAFALGSSADLICAVLGAARVGLIPVLLNATLTDTERDLLADDADPVLRVFDRGRPGRAVRGTARRARPVPADPPHALHLGHHGTAQGRDHRPVGRGHGPGRLRGRGLGLAVRPRRPPPRLLADVPHRLHPLLGRHAALGGLAGHPEPLRRRRRARSPAPAPPHHRLPRADPSAADPPTPRRSGPDERFDSLRLLVHAGAPCPESVKRATMARARPGAVWEFYGSTEAQFTVCSPDEWLERPGTVGRARRGRHLFIAPMDGADAPSATGETSRPRRCGRHHLVHHAGLRSLRLLAQRGGHGAGLARRRLHHRRPGHARVRTATSI